MQDGQLMAANLVAGVDAVLANTPPSALPLWVLKLDTSSLLAMAPITLPLQLLAMSRTLSLWASSTLARLPSMLPTSTLARLPSTLRPRARCRCGRCRCRR